MNQKPDDLRVTAEATSSETPAKHTGTDNGCYGSLSESDSESESVGRARKAAVGLRGSRSTHYTFAEKLEARTVRTPTCWLVQGHGNTRNGYLHIASGSHAAGTLERKLAHRLAYELAFGAIPAGMVVCHRCDNPRCVNPDHLFLGTQQHNIRDAVRKGRWTVRKVTDDQVAELRQIAAGGMRYRELATRFGLSKSTVKHIVARRQRADRIGEPLPLDPSICNVERVPTVNLPLYEMGDLFQVARQSIQSRQSVHRSQLRAVPPSSAMTLKGIGR